MTDRQTPLEYLASFPDDYELTAAEWDTHTQIALASMQKTGHTLTQDAYKRDMTVAEARTLLSRMHAVRYLESIEPDYKLDRMNDRAWNLTELPKGARHWHVVLVTKEAPEDMKGYHVFWYNDKVVAYCKNIHWIDFNEVQQALGLERQDRPA